MIPFTRHLIRLRLMRPARFAQYLHGGILHGLLGHALRNRELPTGLVPTAPECGPLTYATGDAYHLGITLVGEACQELGRIERELRRIGRRRGFPPSMTLGGNFEVEAVETLEPVDLDAEVSALAHGGGVTSFRFVSPLRMKRPLKLACPGAHHLDPQCFPIAHFLDRLWRRLFLLEHGRWPTVDDQRVARPTIPENLEVNLSDLVWVDLPNHRRRRTLGGVVGRIEGPRVPEDWIPAFVLGRHLQAGASTHFAFGRYVIGDDFGVFEMSSRLFSSRQEDSRSAHDRQQ